MDSPLHGPLLTQPSQSDIDHCGLDVGVAEDEWFAGRAVSYRMR